MDKRYQIFVSSTFEDLKEERQKVMQALMTMDCIPSGMELFPADDEEQWEYIQGVIDYCDYYLLIIGGRYGSLSSDNISYTEKEYYYAKEKGIKIIALLHADPSQIIAANSESDPALRQRLEAFRAEAGTSRIRRTWSNPDNLVSEVVLGVNHAIKKYPAVGWVRGNLAASTEILLEINDLRKANAALQLELDAARTAPTPKVADLAGLDETVTINCNCETDYGPRVLAPTLTWNTLFGFISPHLLALPTNEEVRLALGDELFHANNITGYSPYVNDHDFQTIKIQFVALGLISMSMNRSECV